MIKFKYLFLILFLMSSIFVILMLNFIQLVEITKAEQRVNFIRLVENENVTEKLLDTLYLNSLADYCGMTEDKENILFKYSVNNRLESIVMEINELFTSSLSVQHRKFANLSGSCFNI